MGTYTPAESCAATSKTTGALNISLMRYDIVAEFAEVDSFFLTSALHWNTLCRKASFTETRPLHCAPLGPLHCLTQADWWEVIFSEQNIGTYQNMRALSRQHPTVSGRQHAATSFRYADVRARNFAHALKNNKTSPIRIVRIVIRVW